jgi:transcriptional regulator with XRE-family HTH domain
VGGEKVLTFGAILRTCRERAGLTQQEMADKLHRSRSCISKLESDKKSLDVGTLIRWADTTSSREVVCSLIYGIDPSVIVDQIDVITSSITVNFVSNLISIIL